MAQLKREAARQGRTMSELVETALRALFRAQTKPADLSPLPAFNSDGALVDVADRDAVGSFWSCPVLVAHQLSALGFAIQGESGTPP